MTTWCLVPEALESYTMLSVSRQSVSLEDAEDILMENTGVLPKNSSSIIHSICDVIFYVLLMCLLTFAGFLLEFYVFTYR